MLPSLVSVIASLVSSIDNSGVEIPYCRAALAASFSANILVSDLEQCMHERIAKIAVNTIDVADILLAGENPHGAE